jgi:murein DD-endopeptidase MepM/ murein hydrolase activator NlpD
MSLNKSIPAKLRPKKPQDFSTTYQKGPTNWRKNPQIRAVIEPERLATLQLASFLVLALTWQLPSPSLGREQVMSPPVIGSSLINSYRQSETEYSAGHRGVDYEVEIGQGVFAPDDGQVHFVGKVVNRQLISLAHDQNLLSSFEPVCSFLQEGEFVKRGELIGEVCEADQSYQPHCEEVFCLHFSIRKNGEYLSPLWFTAELSPSRLLPWIDPEQL